MSLEDEDLRALRRRPTWLLAAIVVNGTLGLIFLVVPYFRGGWRAREARERFGAFVACLFDGEREPGGGLGLPAGERLRFAEQWLFAPNGWPSSCEETLSSVIPPPAWLVLPAVRVAEDRVAADVEALRRALASTTPRQAPVGTEPLEALRALAASLVLYARETGDAEPLDGAAVRWSPSARLVEPIRLPLALKGEATISLELAPAGARASAVDASGISFVEVGGKGVRQQRIRRPRLVDRLLAAEPVPWLVHTTPEVRCRSDVHRCARKSTGIAPLPLEGRDALPPRWLAGHPIPGIDLRFLGPDRVAMVARRDDGGADLRVFPVPTEAGGSPVNATLSKHLVGFGENDRAVLAEDGSYFTTPGEGHIAIHVQTFEEAGAKTVIAELVGATPPVMLSYCASDEVRWLAFGGGAQVRLAFRRSSGAWTAFDPVPLPWRVSDDPRLVCDRRVGELLFRDEAKSLRTIRCEADRCAPARELAEDVAGFDAVRIRGRTVVAYVNEEGAAPIRLLSYGAPNRITRPTPAACFRDGTGLCGAPTLVAGEGRVALAAREGGDLLLLESTDGGRTFVPHRGLR